MSSEQLAKHWKVVEVQLNQAVQFLNEPDRFSLLDRELEEYRHYIDNKEFELAMDELAGIAQEYGCKSGFWRRLQKAAIQMELDEKVERYENLFHEALARDV